MKTLCYWLIGFLGLFFGLPFISLKINSLDGLGFMLLLFFIINPLFFVVCGIFSGLKLKKRWYLSLVGILFYLLGVWITLDFGNLDCFIYCGFYIVVSYFSMIITALIKQKNITK